VVDFTRLPLHLGVVTASPAAMAALAASGEAALALLKRHATGDWGDADDEERSANWAVISGGPGVVGERLPVDDRRRCHCGDGNDAAANVHRPTRGD